MVVWLRDLTVDEDIRRELPTDDLRLVDGHEYIIIDGINVSEYENINKVNAIAKEIGIDTLELLLKSYLLSEIEEGYDCGQFTILDLTETESWTGISNPDEICGLYLYEQGYNYLPCEVPEELVDYINWEQNWFAAETDGWRKIDNNVVKRYI